ncbi:hypothetical protein FDG09_17130 [Clostridium sporogenes]|uniref:hypothetical protein n=1 Tax=Clostridium sporogenes TaxID=1509 RepID=UPI0013CF8A3C|nr:hypothetical protein [Clostridium sporogenes]NFV14547.1 hypothetical protein [Clostridium sporogenes]
MQYKTNYRVYDRFIITNDMENYGLILGGFSPKVKLWKFKELDELRIDFTVEKIKLININGKGTHNKSMANKPIKLFQEYMDKTGTIRLKEVETSTTREDGSYSFDVLMQGKYFPKYYTVLIKI